MSNYFFHPVFLDFQNTVAFRVFSKSLPFFLVKGNVSAEYWWNESDTRNPKYCEGEKKPSQYLFVHHKPHMCWSGI